MTSNRTPLFLYGGDRAWNSEYWVDSDDRVRGGKSQSYLDCHSPSQAEFHGHLDITALGGAGFASQRTVGVLGLDLSKYDGLLLSVAKSDSKKYTLILRDEILPKRGDGREQSTVSWEYDFSSAAGDVEVQWSDFQPTYRGRPKPDARPLDLTNIKRISFMMRSFFGEQQGDFSLTLNSLAAITSGTTSSGSLAHGSDIGRSSWLGWIYGWFR